jgi:hypothetical protein
MTVLRRLDAVLEPTKQAVVDMRASLDKAKITNQDQALRQAAGQAFYNTSKFTLRDLRARASQQQLKADFEAYLDGFSPNVQDILEKFEFRHQIPRLSKAVERPLRLKGVDPDRAYSSKEIKALKETSERAEDAPPVIGKIHKKGTAPDPLRGLFEVSVKGKRAVVEYEPDPDLRDTEQVPLLEEGGIEAFLRHEVLPHAVDAWYMPDSARTGYEISFTRYFYKVQPLQTLEEIRTQILALEQETQGLLSEILGRRTTASSAPVES